MPELPAAVQTCNGPTLRNAARQDNHKLSH
jgi:hypothetical protein